MEITTEGSNFGGTSLVVKDGNTSMSEYYTSLETDHKDALADQLLSCSEDLARRENSYPQNSEWLKILSAYLDSDDVEKLAELVKGEGR